MIASIDGPFTSFQFSISSKKKPNFELKNVISTKTKDLSRKKWTKFTRF
jgi:hypothetical protein